MIKVFTRFKKGTNKYKTGFTLAEVLITLVIIGVIAALTIPTLMANARKHETVARLKKFYSSLEQARRLAEIETGLPSSDWNYSLNTYKFWGKYLDKHIQTTNTSQYQEEREYGTAGGHYTLNLYRIILNDGSVVFQVDNDGDSMNLGIDVNGDKGPNIFGRDRFIISFLSKRILNDYPNAKPIDSYYSDKSAYRDRKERLSECRSNSRACFGLIMNDGWEIKNDYPYSI